MKHTMKRLMVIMAMVATTMVCAMAQEELPKREVNGKECYEYIIKAGDGLFSIAKRFDVTQAQLHEVNESLSSEIKAGEVIYIPVKRKIERTRPAADAQYHTVEAKQTLYGIAKMYNVAMDSLIVLNPWATTGLREGSKLLLPKGASLNKASQTKTDTTPVKEEKAQPTEHQVMAKETLFAISKRYGISIDELIRINPELKNGLKTGMILHLTDAEETTTEKPVAKKEKDQGIRHIEKKEERRENAEIDLTSKAIVEIKGKTESAPTKAEVEIPLKASPNAVKIAYLLPFMIEEETDKSPENFIDFYRGALIALEEAKKYAVSAEVFVYDTHSKESVSTMDSLMRLKEMKSMDFIIGPAYANQLHSVTQLAKRQNIPTIVPFTRMVGEESIYDKLIQIAPPQEMIFERILTDLYADGHKKYIIGRYENCKNKGKNKGEKFADELAKLLKENNVPFTEVVLDRENSTDLSSLVTDDSTLVVLGSEAGEDVQSAVYQLKNVYRPQLQLWGFEEWNNLLRIYPNTIFYSLFNAHPSVEYTQQYMQYFGPRTTNNNMRYDLLGYDMTMMALLNVKNEKTGLTIEQRHNDIYLQSHSQFSFIGGRYVNLDYHIFLWDGKKMYSL